MTKLVFHGDSITEGADLDRPYTWPKLVENALNIETINAGIGGDTTAGMLGRFSTDVVSKAPEIVIILGGTNDLWWDLDVNPILANIFAMASQARYHNIAPVIGLPLPVWVEAAERQPFAPPVGGYEKCMTKLANLVGALKSYAERSDIPCVDFYERFVDEAERVKEIFYLEDGLHLNRTGHGRMARAVVDFLKSEFLFD